LTALIVEAEREAQPGPYRTLRATIGPALAGLIIFLVLPGEVDVKAHAVLHGICAQRPSHSIWISGKMLPVDARMTGIYLAAATTLLWLISTGRYRALRVPPMPILRLMGLFICAMALDGINGLLVDLGAPHLYVPTNALRLATGILAGTALGVGVVHLFAVSIWATGHRGVATVERWQELMPPLVIASSLGFLTTAGVPSAYGAMVVGLVVAVVGVFWWTGMALIAHVSGSSWSYRSFADLDRLALAGFVAGVSVLLALSALRTVAENLLNLPKLT
jgi:uncharacterized membrane protein